MWDEKIISSNLDLWLEWSCNLYTSSEITCVICVSPSHCDSLRQNHLGFDCYTLVCSVSCFWVKMNCSFVSCPCLFKQPALFSLWPFAWANGFCLVKSVIRPIQPPHLLASILALILIFTTPASYIFMSKEYIKFEICTRWLFFLYKKHVIWLSFSL